MMFITPLKMPADPRPATARPMINAIEFGAVPQIIDCGVLVFEEEVKEILDLLRPRKAQSLQATTILASRRCISGRISAEMRNWLSNTNLRTTVSTN